MCNKKVFFAILGFMVIAVTATFGQTSKNISLADFISTETMYGRSVDFTNEYAIADIWGWSYQGNEYALFAC